MSFKFRDFDYDRLAKQICNKLAVTYQKSDFVKHIAIKKKNDCSPVTEIDLFISELFEGEASRLQLPLISEENTNRHYNFPAIILDPLDGTKEFVKGLGESCVSAAILHSSWNDPQNTAWLFNPMTGFDLRSQNLFARPPQQRDKDLVGLVSQSEFDAGMYTNLDQGELSLVPRGSIAFKLGLLAAGACDFVVSLRGKNLWDIAAGTVLCGTRGIGFWVDGERQKEPRPSYEGRVHLWCREENLETIQGMFH